MQTSTWIERIFVEWRVGAERSSLHQSLLSMSSANIVLSRLSSSPWSLFMFIGFHKYANNSSILRAPIFSELRLFSLCFCLSSFEKFHILVCLHPYSGYSSLPIFKCRSVSDYPSVPFPVPYSSPPLPNLVTTLSGQFLHTREACCVVVE
ncbi:hypothetical protein CPC08DRAFT_506872 [Agrocybe pediades]|nr:hypothetical protein CPC08DRAFT_506872 [Agrocybe pediades]